MKFSILIIDDSLTVRMDLASRFQAAGFNIHLSANLAQARETLTHFPIDAIVLDVLLPDGDGVDFLHELREQHHSLPILMLSTEAEVKSRIRGLKAGADEYIGKPYNGDYVVARAGELIRIQQRSANQDCILVIDDSATVLQQLSEILQDAGYRVLGSASGEEGLRAVALHRPSLVIVDSVLPGIDGATVVRRIRLDAALRGTPCLIMTGSEDLGAESRMLDAGADAFLRKGEPVSLLLARVAAVIRASEQPEETLSSSLSQARLLAVDDSPTYLHGLQEMLSGEGFDIVMATSGEEALEMLAVQPVDCILMDVMMPGLGGEEACRRIKAVHGIRDIPLILLTSKSDRESMLQGLASGADDYVTKNAEAEVLRARVRAQLRRKQFQDEKRRLHAELMERELEAAEARATRELAETRAELICKLESKNKELEHAYLELKSTQVKLVHSAKMASLGQLVAGMAHEINNPLAYAISNLSSISNWLEQLAPTVNSALPPELLSKWERIGNRLHSAGEGLDRVKNLVLKLRTFSRLDEGEFKAIEVPDSIESVLSFLEHRTRDGITIERNYNPTKRLECFPGPLNQVIMNLVANAIDAIQAVSEEGVITITTSSDETWYRISVADTGAGLAPGSEDKLFEPFFTTKPVGQGTGLGLSISFGIIQGHHGHLRAANRPEGGCEFTIEIPLNLSSLLGAAS